MRVRGTNRHSLNTLLGQSLRIGLGRISSDATDPKFLTGFGVTQEGFDNRAAL